jgi:uncharacterized protein YndB with AHSA1/START domain
MTAVAPVRRHVVVNAGADHCFRVFTEGVDRWWPRQHHIGASPLARAVIEPRQGGRWFAICQDGTECDTGKVLVWDPPRRLVLTWQLTAEWKFDPEFVTEIEVTFEPQGPARTLVTLEHRNLDRYGASAPELRKSIDSPEGWGGILDAFTAIAEGR